MERGTAVREPTHPLPRYERQILSDEDGSDEEPRVSVLPRHEKPPHAAVFLPRTTACGGFFFQSEARLPIKIRP